MPLSNVSPDGAGGFQVSTTESSNAFAVGTLDSPNLQTVSQGPSGMAALLVNGFGETNPERALVLVNLASGTLQGEELLGSLSGAPEPCGPAISGSSTGAATAFAKAEAATISADAVEGAAVLWGGLNSSDMAYYSTVPGAKGALVYSGCTQQIETEESLYAPIGFLNDPDAGLQSLSAVWRASGGGIASAVFAVSHTPDFAAEGVTTLSGWSEPSSGLGIQGMVPTSAGPRLVGLHDNYDGLWLMTLDLTPTGAYRQPLAPQ